MWNCAGSTRNVENAYGQSGVTPRSGCTRRLPIFSCQNVVDDAVSQRNTPSTKSKDFLPITQHLSEEELQPESPLWYKQEAKMNDAIEPSPCSRTIHHLPLIPKSSARDVRRMYASSPRNENDSSPNMIECDHDHHHPPPTSRRNVQEQYVVSPHDESYRGHGNNTCRSASTRCFEGEERDECDAEPCNLTNPTVKDCHCPSHCVECAREARNACSCCQANSCPNYSKNCARRQKTILGILPHLNNISSDKVWLLPSSACERQRAGRQLPCPTDNVTLQKLIEERKVCIPSHDLRTDRQEVDCSSPHKSQLLMEPEVNEPTERTTSTAECYRIDEKLPLRFRYPGMIKGYNTRPDKCRWQTSNAEYGMTPPSIHHVPVVYHCRTWKLWEHLLHHGMYRDHKLTTRLPKQQQS